MATNTSYYFYVLLCQDGSFYGGFTTDVSNRFESHKSGHGAKYTKTHHPIRILYQERFESKHDALSAEWHFKHQSRPAKEKFLRLHHVDFSL
ncbi:GIY-YIG nuclease family protein [Levilactobacillus bambusae]|uniref:Endonuclease n=1 Tax=Levilactobacillus bambusae TaxID=2024736 RepID=A0A2V1N211_9LACO|nr:GIY-YIG nuclease family protein [Levilactobacillus bambusae]PWG00718.1 endonuclease [Levilactobacillus bambusae]